MAEILLLSKNKIMKFSMAFDYPCSNYPVWRLFVLIPDSQKRLMINAFTLIVYVKSMLVGNRILFILFDIIAKCVKIKR